MFFVIAFFIRAFNSVLQILSVLFLSKNLSLDEFGIYSGFIIVLGYFNVLGGFSIMSFLTRKISIVSKENQSKLLYQIWLYLLITIPISILFTIPLFQIDLIKWDHFFYFILLIFLSCFSLQLENFAIATRRTFIATFNITLRNIWIPLLILSKLIFNIQLNLDIIFISIIFSEIISITYNTLNNQRLKINPQKFYPFDKKLFKETIKGSFIITLLILSTLLITSNQRIFLEFFSQSKDLGIFQFYVFIATGIPNLLDSTIYSFLLPKLILKNKNNTNKVKISLKEKFYLISTSSFFLVIIFFFLDLIISFVDKPELGDFKNIYFLVSIYSLLHINFRIKYVNYYSANKDMFLLKNSLITLLITLIFSIILVSKFSIHGAAVSLLFSGIFENLLMKINERNEMKKIINS